MKLKGLLIKAGERTASGRVFTKAAIEGAFFSAGPKIVERKLIGTFLGPGETPRGTIDLLEIAVVATDLSREKDGTELHAEVLVLETDRGKDAIHASRVIEDANREGGGDSVGRLVLRPRGTGTVGENGEVGEDYILEGVSLCWESAPVGMSFKVNPELLKKPEQPEHE